MINFIQVPYFATMQNIIRASKVRSDANDFKDLTKFAIFVTRKFFKAAQTNLFLFVEAMVPRIVVQKANGCLDPESEAHAIMNHYDDESSKELFERLKGMTWEEMMNGEKRKIAVEWSPEEDEDLKNFFECFKSKGVSRIQLITQALIDEAKMEGKKARVRRSLKEVLQRLEGHGLVKKSISVEAEGLSEASWTYAIPKTKAERAMMEFLAAAHVSCPWQVECPPDAELSDDEMDDFIEVAADGSPERKRPRLGDAPATPVGVAPPSPFGGDFWTSCSERR